MLIVILILFWVSVFLVAHSYVLFPFILQILARKKKQNQIVYKLKDNDLPEVAILLAVYNEESVIEEKIKSTFNTQYPIEKIKLYIGSDASTDRTNQIISSYQTNFAIHLEIFPGRTGKSEIINTLATIASSEIFILTDANVFFKENTIYELIKHYKNEEIAQVGGNILNPVYKEDGISYQEKSYLSRESLIKYREGVIWGAMIGAFGGCYSIRRTQFAPVPKNFLMDDFYISMHVLESGKKAINELDAICEEDVSNKIEEEFRRKVRISAGNFQNLARYKKLLWPFTTGLAFCFLSHKVLRWYSPMIIILIFILNVFLINKSNFYIYTLLLQVILFCIPIIDRWLKNTGLNFKIIRFVTHFYLMNLALLKGWIWYIRGIESNVWKPTQRNQ